MIAIYQSDEKSIYLSLSKVMLCKFKWHVLKICYVCETGSLKSQLEILTWIRGSLSHTEHTRHLKNYPM